MQCSSSGANGGRIQCNLCQDYFKSEQGVDKTKCNLKFSVYIGSFITI